MEVGLSPGDFVLDGDPAPSPKRGVAPIFGPCLLWPNRWMDQDATWYRCRPRPRRHCVRWGPSSPPPQKKRYSPQFSTHVYCGETAVCIRIPLGTEVGLSLGDIVLDGYPAPPRLKRYSPQFSANVRCDQTVGWTKMPLGMEVGLGPGDFVFDGDLAFPEKKAQPRPIFVHVCCDQTAG